MSGRNGTPGSSARAGRGGGSSRTPRAPVRHVGRTGEIAIRPAKAWAGGTTLAANPYLAPRNASNSSGRATGAGAASTLAPPATPRAGHRRRNSSFFNVVEVDVDELDDEAHVPLTSAGYNPAEYEDADLVRHMSVGLVGDAVAQPKKNLSGKKKLTAATKGSMRQPALEPEPDNKFYQFYQAVKYLNNSPITPRPDYQVAGQLVSDAFLPALKLRRRRMQHLQAMQRTWLEYGVHKADQHVFQHLLLNSSVSAREFDMMILGKLGPTIFGSQTQRRGLFASSNPRDTFQFDTVPTPVNTGASLGAGAAATNRFSLRRSDRSLVELFDPMQLKLNVNQLRASDPRERVRIAAGLVRDAIARRHPKARSKWRRAFAWFYENPAFQALLMLAVLVYTMLIFFEPGPGDSARSVPVLLTEAACLLVLLLAVAFRFLQSGLQMFRNGWVLLLVACTGLFVADALASFADPTSTRFSRALRPFLLLSLHPSLSQVTLTFTQALRNLTLLSLFALATLGVFALLGVAAFHAVPGYESFASLPRALLTLYQSFAARDMAFMYPGFLSNEASLVFFVPFCVLVLFVIAALLFAQLYSTFDAQVQIDAIRARIQERRALAAAFALLDQQAEQRLGFINLSTFSLLLAEVYHAPPPKREVEMLFRFVDHDNNNLIDILEFFNLCDILFLRFHTASRVRRQGTWLARTLGIGEEVYVRIRDRLNESIVQRLVVQRRAVFDAVTASLVVVNAALVLGFALANGNTASPLLTVFNWIFSVLFVIELALRVAALGFREFWIAQRHRFDTVIVVASLLGEVLRVLPGATSNTLAAGIALSTLRLLRVATMVPALRRTGRQVYGAARPTLPLLVFTAVFVYAFAAVGLDVFGDRFKLYQDGVLVGTFATFPRAFATLLYVAFSADWPGFLAQAQTAAPSAGIGIAYFVAYTLAVVLILLNLVNALIVLMFVQQSELEAPYPDEMLQLLDPNLDLDLFGRPRRPLVLPDLPRLPRDYPVEDADIDAIRVDERKVVTAQRYVRGFLARRTLARRKQQVEAREFIAQEILETEKSYTKALDDLISQYLRPLSAAAATSKKGILPAEDITAVFSVVEILANYNNALRGDLEKRLASWSRMSRIGDVFIRAAAFLKTYTMYITNMTHALERVEYHRKKTKAFRAFLQDTEARLGGVTLESLLIQPVQRLPRYELLLGEMLKNTWRDHPDYQYLRTALRKMEEVNEYMDERKREQESKAKVHEIALKLTGVDKGFQLEQPWRLYICQGRMNELRYETLPDARTRLGPPKERMVFLFTDILMITTRKGSKLRVNQVLSLSNVDPEMMEDEKRLAGIQFGVYIHHPQHEAVLTARSFNGQRNWLHNLKQAIHQEQDRMASFNDVSELQNSGVGDV